MKCRICGYELDGATPFCPMCGSKVNADDIAAMHTAVNGEFSWNTCDFPKPKQMRDIKMEWQGKGAMNEVASEGFVQTDCDDIDNSVLQPQVARPVHRNDADFSMPTWHMPEQRVADNTPLWATQPLWDAKHLPREILDTSIPETSPLIPFERETPQAAEITSAPEVLPAENNKREEAPSNEKIPERFNTFVSKNEEFQQLLQEQWNRTKALRDGDTLQPLAFTGSLNTGSSVAAPELSAFEEMLNAGTISADDFIEVPDQNNDDTIEEMLQDSRSEVAKVRDTIETRIREIREREAEIERKKGSKAMADARRAYFGAIEKAETKVEIETVSEIEKTEPVQAEMQVENEPASEETNEEATQPEIVHDNTASDEAPAAVVAEPKEVHPDVFTVKEEKVLIGEPWDDNKVFGRFPEGDKKDEGYNDFQKALDEVMRQEPIERVPEKSHWFGKLLISIILIIVVLEAIIMALRYFIPDHEVTQMANMFEQMVIDMCRDVYAQVSEFIKGLIDKYINKI